MTANVEVILRRMRENNARVNGVIELIRLSTYEYEKYFGLARGTIEKKANEVIGGLED